MKKPVNDDLVAEYAKRLRSGGRVGEVFPYPLPECEFTESQKRVINDAHRAREKILQKSKPQPATQPKLAPKAAAPKPSATPPPLAKVVIPKPAASVSAPAPKSQSLRKLEKMFYLQHGKCFFCGEKLALSEANIEHLNPLSLGGTRTEDNEVVCHKTLNETFGNLPLKQKFEFVLKAAGSISCPKK